MTCCVQISWNLADGKSVKSCVVYLTKISPGSPAVATARMAPNICCGQLPTIYPECSRFQPNRFTSGAVIAERVNTAKTRREVNPIFGWSLASSRIEKSAQVGDAPHKAKVDDTVQKLTLWFASSLTARVAAAARRCGMGGDVIAYGIKYTTADNTRSLTHRHILDSQSIDDRCQQICFRPCLTSVAFSGCRRSSRNALRLERRPSVQVVLYK